MSQAKTVKQVLTAAKWMIENIGWTKGSYRAYDEEKKTIGFCSLGALDAVEANGKVKGQAQAHMYYMIPGRAGVAAWQDDAVRTKQEVLDFFDKAIATKPTKKKL
jgi:hypothetical protein